MLDAESAITRGRVIYEQLHKVVIRCVRRPFSLESTKLTPIAVACSLRRWNGRDDGHHPDRCSRADLRFHVWRTFIILFVAICELKEGLFAGRGSSPNERGIPRDYRSRALCFFAILSCTTDWTTQWTQQNSLLDVQAKLPALSSSYLQTLSPPDLELAWHSWAKYESHQRCVSPSTWRSASPTDNASRTAAALIVHETMMRTGSVHPELVSSFDPSTIGPDSLFSAPSADKWLEQLGGLVLLLAAFLC